MPSILIVDDEENFRDRLTRAFSKRGYHVFSAANYEQAIKCVSDNRPNLAVFDLKMPGKSGLELLRDAKKLHPELEVIVLTGYGSIATAIEAVKMGALSYVAKPVDVDDIISSFSKEEKPGVKIDSESLQAPSLARMEWEHINRVLTDCGGNISAAAKQLGLHRRTLQRKLQKYPPRK